ncbi:MAG: NAD(P)H-hydrate epimerase, partial [Bacteroidetes bacterium]|nr:NAD(P)H-hydrate epimerase [Bacteroidota bacterium]
MLILSAKQIHDWDSYTIQHKPIASIDLMESAAIRCFQWIQQRELLPKKFSIFCGKGNNGGDGLAIARLLARHGAEPTVHILELGQKGTADFQANLTRLHEAGIAVHYIQSPEHFPAIPAGNIVIDALFGTGLNRRLDGLTASLVEHINATPNYIIAIDMPSGLLADNSSKGFPVIHANTTLSFQCLKLAFMMAENEAATGDVHVLDIGLLQNFLS